MSQSADSREAKIALASDHAGFNTKEEIKKTLSELGIEYIDLGTNNSESCDYPDFAFKVAEAVRDGDCQKGILCCGSGIGVSMVANKVRGVRAALCHDELSATLSRQHNNSNILCMGERTTPAENIAAIIKAWLAAEFEGGRHQRRIDKFERARLGESEPWSCSQTER